MRARTPLIGLKAVREHGGRPVTELHCLRSGIPVTCLLLLFLVIGPHPVLGQRAVMRGLVTDASNGEPLPAVNVVLRDSEGALKGATTDGNGYYYVGQIRPGSYRLSVSFVGYETQTYVIDLKGDALETRDFSLVPTTITGAEVVVESEAPRTAAVTAGLQTIRPVQIEMIPVPDVSGDLMGYLQILPGVFTSGDRGGQLFVRGGTPSQNLALVDGMPIYQPFHIIGFFSSFPSEIVRQTDFYAGGFGARYGGRLSSVIDVTTRNGNKYDFEGSVSVAPFLTSMHVEGPLSEGRTSVIVSLRESLAERLAPGLWSGAEPFRFGDQFVKVHSNLDNGSQFSATMLRTHDRGRIDETQTVRSDNFIFSDDNLPIDLPEEEVGWSNMIYGFSYFTVPEGGILDAELNGSISLLRNWAGPIGSPDRGSRLWTIQSSTRISELYGPVKVEWGAAIDLIRVKYDLAGTFQDLDVADDNRAGFGPYADAEWPISNSLNLNPGLHVHAFVGGNAAVKLEPRLRAVWLPFGPGSPHQISGAWGLYHQNLVGLQDDRDAGDVFTAWAFSRPREHIPLAVHTLAGWRYSPSKRFDFGVEAYYRTMTNLAVPAWSASPRFTTTIIPADGRVKGADLRISVDKKPFYAYAGYGIQEVVYTARQGSFGIWYGTSEESYSPPHDRRHQVNLLASVDLGFVEADLRWEYGSGIPFTRPIGFDDWIMFDKLVDVTKDPGDYRVLFERPYQGRLPSYHRLDVSIKRGIDLRDARLTVQAGAINAYDRVNLFYYDVWTLQRVNQMSFMATLGIKIETR